MQLPHIDHKYKDMIYINSTRQTQDKQQTDRPTLGGRCRVTRCLATRLPGIQLRRHSEWRRSGLGLWPCQKKWVYANLIMLCWCYISQCKKKLKFSQRRLRKSLKCQMPANRPWTMTESLLIAYNLSFNKEQNKIAQWYICEKMWYTCDIKCYAELECIDKYCADVTDIKSL